MTIRTSIAACLPVVLCCLPAKAQFVRSSDPVPGIPTSTLGNITLLAVAGQADAVLACNVGPSASGFTRRGLLVVGECDQRRLVAVQGDAVPGLAGTNFTIPLDANIDRLGKISFLTGLVTNGVPVGTGVFREEPNGSFTLLARTNDVITPVVRITDRRLGFSGSPDGSVLFSYSTAGEASTGFVYFAATPGNPAVQVLRRGQALPGFAPTAILASISSNIIPRIASNGVVAASVQMGGDTSQGSAGIAYGPPGNVQVPFRTTMALPDLPGSRITSIGAWNLGDDGTLAVALRANTASGQQELVYAGIPSASGGFGTMRQLARRGDQIPSAAAGTTFGELGPANFPPGIYVGPSGDVVVATFANTTPPTGSQTILVWYPAPFRGLPPQVIAEGSIVVDGMSVRIRAGDIALDSTGALTFRADLPIDRSTVLRWSPSRGVRDPLATGTFMELTALPPGEFSGSTFMNVINDIGAAGITSTAGIRLSLAPNQCNSIDIDRDGIFPSDNDLICFINIYAGGVCETTNSCGAASIDFNNDGLFPDDLDITLLLQVFAGRLCDG